MMSELARAALLLGGALGALGLLCVLAPRNARVWVEAFPRSRPAGWVLAAVALVWSARLLLAAPLGRFEGFKPLAFLATPVAFFLVVHYVDELLAARALGGILLLVPAPILDVARWHGSAWRFVVVLLAYLMAIKGIVLVLSPYQFRRKAALCIRDDGHCRVCGGIALTSGALVVALALAVY